MSGNEPLNFRMECLNPILYVKDMEASLAFYVGVLGFKKAEWGDDSFTSVNRDNTGIYLCKGAQGAPGTWVWMGFDGDIFSLHQMFISNGIKINYRQPISPGLMKCRYWTRMVMY